MDVLAPVSTIMTKDLITVSPGASLMEVRDLFITNNIHHLPVVRFSEIIGMVSKTDFLYFQYQCLGEEAPPEQINDRLKQVEVKDIMRKNLATLESEDSIKTAIDLFLSNLYHALPILKNGALVGMLTTHDLIKALA